MKLSVHSNWIRINSRNKFTRFVLAMVSHAPGLAEEKSEKSIHEYIVRSTFKTCNRLTLMNNFSCVPFFQALWLFRSKGIRERCLRFSSWSFGIIQNCGTHNNLNLRQSIKMRGIEACVKIGLSQVLKISWGLEIEKVFILRA